MPTPTRGVNISAYSPAFANGAQVNTSQLSASAVKNANISAKAVTSAKIRAAFLSGTLVSGRAIRAIAHGLAVKPKLVLVGALLTLTQANSATIVDVRSGISASTSTNIYIHGSQPANGSVKYMAYVQL